ncbi:MAG: cell division protein FtsQ/DivIB [Flavobacterium sp.]
MKIVNRKNIQLVLMFAIVLFLFAFTSHRNESRKILKTEVQFVGDNNLLVTTEMVNKLLIDKSGGSKSIAKDKLDLNELEKSINKHDMIEKSEVFVSIDGILKAVVTQRTPIARYYDENSSFYIDSKGSKMPLSEIYAARVPLISGRLTSENQPEIAALLKIIYTDDFLKKNITGMTIENDGDVILNTRNYDYDILFGKTINMEAKFNNYKAFYQKAVSDSSINYYKKINLKFTQQVVCTK